MAVKFRSGEEIEMNSPMLPDPPALRRSRSLRRISTSQGSFDALVPNTGDEWNNQHLALLVLQLRDQVTRLHKDILRNRNEVLRNRNQNIDNNSCCSVLVSLVTLGFVLVIIVLEGLDLADIDF